MERPRGSLTCCRTESVWGIAPGVGNYQFLENVSTTDLAAFSGQSSGPAFPCAR
ncbi:hypothetical protein [Streptomyces sp. B21-083]|uniref:hypothetical protein n=1 Tax=Streptomyces sp. B21-083 TaxID=3039410 RepID=UPI002FF0CAAA